MSWDGENWEIFVKFCAFQTWTLNIFQNRPIALVIGVVTALIALFIQWSISVCETLNQIQKIRNLNFNQNVIPIHFLKILGIGKIEISRLVYLVSKDLWRKRSICFLFHLNWHQYWSLSHCLFMLCHGTWSSRIWNTPNQELPERR